MPSSKYRFFRQTQQIEETITARYDPLKEWRPDPAGYFLIRVNRTKKQIEAGLVTYRHVIIKKVIGKYAIEIYNTIIKHKLISKLEHAAYLGKELYKAEVALKYGVPYKQEFPVDLPLPSKVTLKEES